MAFLLLKFHAPVWRSAYRHSSRAGSAAAARIRRLRLLRLYLCGGGGEKISRLRPGSGFGFGLGAFLTSFLPLSLFPMQASMTQKPKPEKGQTSCRVQLFWNNHDHFAQIAAPRRRFLWVGPRE